MKNRAAWILAFDGMSLVGGTNAQTQGQAIEWKDWGGNSARMHYSPLN